MFRSKLIFKDTTPDDVLERLKKEVAEGFQTRCGTVIGKENGKYEVVYETDDSSRYSLGITNLTDNKRLVDNLAFWDWNDTEAPDEYTDILEDMKTWTC